MLSRGRRPGRAPVLLPRRLGSDFLPGLALTSSGAGQGGLQPPAAGHVDAAVFIDGEPSEPRPAGAAPACGRLAGLRRAEPRGSLGAPLMAAFSALRTSLFVGGGEGRGEEVGEAVAVARCCALCSIVLSSLWSPPLWHCRSPAGDELGDWIDDVRACTWHCGGIPVLGRSNFSAKTACPQ